MCLSVGFCLSACSKVGLSKGCQPQQVPPLWVWYGTSKHGYSPGPWPALPAGKRVASKEEKLGEKRMGTSSEGRLLVSPAASPWPMSPRTCMEISSRLYQSETRHVRTIHGLLIVPPSLVSSLLVWLIFFSSPV